VGEPHDVTHHTSSVQECVKTACTQLLSCVFIQHWKAAACFTVLSKHLPEVNEENHDHIGLMVNGNWVPLELSPVLPL
jgi:hypothetical protein